LKKPKKNLKIAPGGVKFVFNHNFYYFFLGANAKIGNPTTTHSVVLNSGGKKKTRKQEKYVCWQSRRKLDI
jgi:hypothetical protein